MTQTILVTGGAGFVGSHTADALLALGHRVRVFDNLSPQVHGVSGRPSYLSHEIELIKGDVRDLATLSRAVRGADVIYHLAASVGVGQSMYEIADYAEVNIQGTANLLQAILDTRSRPEKLIVASSMSIYREGPYLYSERGDVSPTARPIRQLIERQWEVLCPVCCQVVKPVATAEAKPLQSTSIYALSKKCQEEMVLLFGRTYEIPSVAFRYFNIYGPRQALSNPYTGVAAIFASRLMHASRPLVFEDGFQLRDFVNVHDIVQANLLAMHSTGADGLALNVGSGKPVTVTEVAAEIADAMGTPSRAEITGKYRSGDIRHCFADISQISSVLGYKPRVKFKDGVAELVNWLRSQESQDNTQEALEHLATRGLVA